jgi:hypothetical protein
MAQLGIIKQTLLSNTPNKLSAMRTECRLSQEKSHELVSRNFVDLSSHGTTTLTIIEGA